MFLRFISPAIVSPESIDIEVPKENEPTMRKGLMVVAKVVQNLANNMFFGKQAHMAPLNDFLKNNIVVVTRFLSDLNVCTMLFFVSSRFLLMTHQKYDTRGDPPDPEEWIGLPYDDTDSIVLHIFFDKHADKVGKELLSLSRPSEADAPAINGKKAWDNLCAALVDLDSSVPPPQPSPLDRSSHEGYLEFMGTHIDADTSSVSHLFVDSTPSDVSSEVFYDNPLRLNLLQRTKTLQCSSCSPPRLRQIPSTWSCLCTTSSGSVHPFYGIWIADESRRR